MKRERYPEAAFFLKKALDLGPPSVGMNAYYLAKCLQQAGNTIEAVKAFYESIDCDSFAISHGSNCMKYMLKVTIH